MEYLSFYQLWVKRSRSQVHWASCDYLKAWVLMHSKVNLRFRRTDDNAFSQGIWRAPVNVASWVFKMPFVCSLNERIEDAKHSESVVKTSQTVQMHERSWTVKWVPWSLRSLRGVSSGRENFSKRTLATEETVASLQMKASVQCENIQTITKTYLYPWDGGSGMKCICQTSNGPFGNSKCPGAVLTGFPWLYFRQVGQERQVHFVAFLIKSPHQHWSMKAVIWSVDQWFNEHTVVKGGNFRISNRTGFLFGSNQSFLFLQNDNCWVFTFFFSFLRPIWGISSQFFKIIFRESIPLDNDTDLAAAGPFKSNIPVEIAARWFFLASKKSSLESPGMLITAKLAS